MYVCHPGLTAYLWKRFEWKTSDNQMITTQTRAGRPRSLWNSMLRQFVPVVTRKKKRRSNSDRYTWLLVRSPLPLFLLSISPLPWMPPKDPQEPNTRSYKRRNKDQVPKLSDALLMSRAATHLRYNHRTNLEGTKCQQYTLLFFCYQNNLLTP